MFFIILDEITDPHNLGTIIRTADAVGAHGVIIPKRRSVHITPIVAKASAGAIEYMPVCKVTNIVNTIKRLKEEINVLQNIKAEKFMLSHRTPFEKPKGIIMRWLGEIYDRRVKGEVYIEV